MKIIVLSPFLYYPGVPHGGGALCWGQLEGLARQHEVHFLAFSQHDSAELNRALPSLEKVCASVTTVKQPLDKLTILRAKLALWFKLRPVGATICASGAMTAALEKSITLLKPDAVLVQFPQMAQYIADCGTLPAVMDVQDSYSVSAYRQFKAQSNPVKKAQSFLNWLGWLRYEAQWYARFAVVATLTEQDRLGLEVFTPGLGAKCSPAAVQVPARCWQPVAAKTIAFIGSFSHPPNVDALLFFIREVLPLVLQRCPDAVFEVAGKGVPAAVQAMANSNLRFLGVVPDAFEFVCSAAVVVVPLLSGGGIKIKTLEAMASGCPIVSTSIGAEETGAVSGTQMLVADTASAFADAVVRLLQDQTTSARLGSNARALIENKFSWEAKWASLDSLISQVAEGRSQ